MATTAATTAAAGIREQLTSRIQDLLNENAALKAQVKELETSWGKVEKLLSSGVATAKATVRRNARTAVKRVGRAVKKATR